MLEDDQLVLLFVGSNGDYIVESLYKAALQSFPHTRMLGYRSTACEERFEFPIGTKDGSSRTMGNNLRSYTRRNDFDFLEDDIEDEFVSTAEDGILKVLPN